MWTHDESQTVTTATAENEVQQEAKAQIQTFKILSMSVFLCIDKKKDDKKVSKHTSVPLDCLADYSTMIVL